jgi:hypothetical protein
MKILIFLTIAAAALYWCLFLRDKPDCGCGQHKDLMPDNKSDGANQNPLNDSNSAIPSNVWKPAPVLKSMEAYPEPYSQPNGEPENIERGNYKSVFGDEGDAGESETYE